MGFVRWNDRKAQNSGALMVAKLIYPAFSCVQAHFNEMDIPNSKTECDINLLFRKLSS